MLTMVVVFSLREQGLLRRCCNTLEKGSKASENADLSAQRSAMELIIAILVSRRAFLRSSVSSTEASGLEGISQNLKRLLWLSDIVSISST